MFLPLWTSAGLFSLKIFYFEKWIFFIIFIFISLILCSILHECGHPMWHLHQLALLCFSPYSRPAHHLPCGLHLLPTRFCLRHYFFFDKRTCLCQLLHTTSLGFQQIYLFPKWGCHRYPTFKLKYSVSLFSKFSKIPYQGEDTSHSLAWHFVKNWK